MVIKNILDMPSIQRHIHDGDGLALSTNLFGAEDFETKLRYVSYTVLPPATSIGYHEHEVECEEIYLILRGQGLFTLDGEITEVRAGDVVVTGIGQHHGLENDTCDDLVLFVFWVEK